MDFRNEYRIRPNGRTYYPWSLDYRKWWSPFWTFIDSCENEEKAVQTAKLHAGVGTKSLGRLP